MAADTTHEHERSDDMDDGDFVSYLAHRLNVEAREARERVSAWLTAYEPPPKSGPRRAVPRPDATDDTLERSA